MSEEMDEGGKAFPDKYGSGMSLREWYAGMAMQGLLASMAHPQATGSNLDCYPQLPKQAFQIADAMIAESKKGATHGN